MNDRPRSETKIAIVGAGLGGTLLACYLGKSGFDVTVYERRADPRIAGFIGGRSINLALSTRGLHALRGVGLADTVMLDAIPMRGRMMHDEHGKLTYQPYSANPEDAINSVSRGRLNMTLLDAAEQYPNVRIMFNHRCLSLDLDGPMVHMENLETSEFVVVQADHVFGADGAFSAVRGQMEKVDRFDYSQQYLEHGYKELTIPPTADGEFALEPNVLHIWPRGGFMMIALPNQDRTFTCTCFWPYAGQNGFTNLQTPQEIREYFARVFPDAARLMPNLVEEYQQNPVGSMLTVRCHPWHFKDKVVLIGDAAHAIVPFYGQGMNAAFEDCTEFDRLLDLFSADDHVNWEALLPAFTNARKEHADAIADMALVNFIEMRDRVGSKLFLLRKRLEKVLHRLFPTQFLPLYNMVSFSTIPFAQARKRATGQQRALIAIAGIGLLVVLFMIVAVLVLILPTASP